MGWGQFAADMAASDKANYQNWYNKMDSWINGNGDQSNSLSHKIPYWQQSKGWTGSNLYSQVMNDMLTATGGWDALNPTYAASLVQAGPAIESQWEAVNHSLGNAGANLASDLGGYIKSWLGGGMAGQPTANGTPSANSPLGVGGGYGWGTLTPTQWSEVINGGGPYKGIIPQLSAYSQAVQNGGTPSPDAEKLWSRLSPSDLLGWMAEASQQTLSPMDYAGELAGLQVGLGNYERNARTTDWANLFNQLNQMGYGIPTPSGG